MVRQKPGVWHEAAMSESDVDQAVNRQNVTQQAQVWPAGLTTDVNECILINVSRPVTITTDQILDAAREVFLEKGFNASTAEIAKRAGVSEGSLFNRFATKEELFLAAVGVSAEPPWFSTMERLSGRGDPKENLVDLYVEIIEHFRRIFPLITMRWASKVHPLNDFKQMDDPPPVRIQRKLTEFFAREIELGRMRPCDPQLAAAAYMGAIHHLAMVEMMGHQDAIPVRRYAEEMVELLWKGYATDASR
jgi:AcrR family transcriptional regulator